MADDDGGGGLMGWVIFILIFGVGNLILYSTTGMYNHSHSTAMSVEQVTGGIDESSERAIAPAGAHGGWRALAQARSAAGSTAVAAWALPCTGRLAWPVAAVILGAGPFLLGYATGLPGQQLVTALGLALLTLAFARRDAWLQATAAIALVYVVHCAVVIAVTYSDPEGAVAHIPEGREYWQKQYTWITTGQDPEYAFSAWVPAHVLLLVAMILLGLSSFGVVVFYQGFFEVDWMNYYNGQLLAHSIDVPTALLLGWHPWSVLRGIGYVFIAFEIVSLALQLFSGRRISTFRTRRLRWMLGLAFIVADGVTKALLLEPVRQCLLSNMRGS